MIFRVIFAPLLLLFVSCAPEQSRGSEQMDDMTEPADPSDLEDLDDVNLDCDLSAALDGWNGATPSATEFASLNQAGVTICLTLDSTLNQQRAHFAAATGAGAGTASLVEIALFNEEDRLLEEGWDVTLGQSSPSTFANLEYSLPAGNVTKAKLFVRSLATTPSATRLELSFFEPFE